MKKYRLIGHDTAQHGTKRIDRSFNAKDKKDAVKKAKEFIKLVVDYPSHHSSSFELCERICKIKEPKIKKHEELSREASFARTMKVVKMNNNG